MLFKKKIFLDLQESGLIYYGSGNHDQAGEDTIKSDGEWDRFLHSGRSEGDNCFALRFKFSSGEVRP